VDWDTYEVLQLKAELKTRGLDQTGKKADLVQRLKDADGQVSNGPAPILNQQDVLHIPEVPNPEVVNLLLSTIYGELVRPNNLRALPGCPIAKATATSIIALINKLPAFQTADQLAISLKLPRTPANELLFLDLQHVWRQYRSC
jgi:hypothetical protein